MLAHGHDVLAVGRSPVSGAAESRNLTHVFGNIGDRTFIRQSLECCDAVVSCLGQNRASKSQFAKRTSPHNLLNSTTQIVVDAISQSKKHFVYMSAFGVGSDLRRHSIVFRTVLRVTSIGDAYRDHANAERTIKASGIDWTIVRPVGLTDEDIEVPLIDKGNEWSSFETASKRSVAAYPAHCIERRDPLHRTVTVGRSTGAGTDR
ncbi:SDR family oxidoreductase [Rhizobium sp. XQZ8]|nr:SDR family oxidoreductase [Rhizobium populisoli]